MDEDEVLLAHLRETFRMEAEEHLERISSGLLDMEKAPTAEGRSKNAEAVLREAHSLKGAARAVSMGIVETACRHLEGLFGAVKRGELAVTPRQFDGLHRIVDAVRNLLSAPGTDRTALSRGILELLDAVKSGPESGSGTEPEPAPGPAASVEAVVRDSAGPVEADLELSDTVRIPAKKLRSLLLLTEGMLALKVEADQRVQDVHDLLELAEPWKREWEALPQEIGKTRRSLREIPQFDGLARLLPAVERLLDAVSAGRERVGRLTDMLSAAAFAAERERQSGGAIWTELLDEARRAFLFPFSSLMELFPRMVREIAREEGKEADLVVDGAGIEVDRRVLEELKDPLVHMVRNSIGHGIEKPEARTGKGKPRRGTITVAISHRDGRTVEILVSDDGAGIDPAAVKEAAVRVGAITGREAESAGDRETLDLVFRSDVTTSRIITDISGRGLGLAIAREKVAKLGGTISVESGPSTGTSFRITAPVSLAGLRGVVVRIGDRLFVVPTASVRRVLRIGREEIKTAGNRELVPLDEAAVPLVPLGDVLGIGSDGTGGAVLALVLEAESRLAAFAVDEVLAEQELLVKGFGRQLTRVRCVSGATILGSGRVVPILNAADLLKTAWKAAESRAAAMAGKAAETVRKSILVVEDSITSRMLLKNILESAGYRVKTAVDGVDAITELKTASYDLVVSDIDMPRMNGVELTVKIRGDRNLRETPVVLVTALDSREDRERGIDAGANAYIVKSGFDQGNLLEIVRRLAGRGAD